jgi:hypothetical protein
MLASAYILLSRYLRTFIRGLESQSCAVLFSWLLRPELSSLRARACLFIVCSRLQQRCLGSASVLLSCSSVILACVLGSHTVQTQARKLDSCTFQNCAQECLHILSNSGFSKTETGPTYCLEYSRLWVRGTCFDSRVRYLEFRSCYGIVCLSSCR